MPSPALALRRRAASAPATSAAPARPARHRRRFAPSPLGRIRPVARRDPPQHCRAAARAASRRVPSAPQRHARRQPAPVAAQTRAPARQTAVVARPAAGARAHRPCAAASACGACAPLRRARRAAGGGTGPCRAVGGGGGYAVQVTSQRSEAEAQAAYVTCRPNSPISSAATQPIIRRADLGAKGIYYRALVGPFASVEQAAGCAAASRPRAAVASSRGIKRLRRLTLARAAS